MIGVFIKYMQMIGQLLFSWTMGASSHLINLPIIIRELVKRMPYFPAI